MQAPHQVGKNYIEVVTEAADVQIAPDLQPTSRRSVGQLLRALVAAVWPRNTH